MFGAYRQWRHAGEENAIAIFNFSIRADLVFVGVMSAMLWLVLSATSDVEIRYFIGAFTLLGFIRVLAKRRIAIIFTSSELIYRSALASPHRVRLRGVQAMKRGLIYLPWEPFPWAWYSHVEGVVLELPYSQSVAVRLDLPHADEIVQRLTDMTGVPVSAQTRGNGKIVAVLDKYINRWRHGS